MNPLLSLSGVDAGYDGVPVVYDLDLTVGEGEVVALLGSNGAGKTTTLLTISGLLPRLGGELTVLGAGVSDGRHRTERRTLDLARRGLAHVPEDRALFFELTAGENLRLGAQRGDDEAVETALESFPRLHELSHRNAGLLSGGEQQMLALARALAGRPRLLLIDEMSLGLAPIVVEQLLPTVRAIADDTGAGVLLVEQQVPAALAIADRVYVLRRGRVAIEGNASDLRRRRDLLEASYLGDIDEDK
ncbi:MAG: ABC transporter ATP-binding protein [Acidimicrobiia bacterium]|nr:ABC transporter ATP-binding protein [Acidimicrobiia bacterium]